MKKSTYYNYKELLEKANTIYCVRVVSRAKELKMRESIYYNYKELVEKATATGATKEDRLNLLNWFESFGRDYWHFDHYTMENDIRLFPVWQGVGEPDEDGEFWDYELVDADIRY